MEKINSWCRLIAVLSVFSSVATGLIPEGKLKKAFGCLCSLAVFSVFFFGAQMPEFGKLKNEFESRVSSFSFENSQKENELLEKEGTAMVEKALETFLQDKGVDCDFSIRAEFEDSRLLVKEIAFHSAKGREKQEIEKLLEPYLDGDILLIFGEAYE